MASEDWAKKFTENEVFLNEIGILADLKDAGKPEKCLWAMTHLLNLLECEFWYFPALEGDDVVSGSPKLRCGLLEKISTLLSTHPDKLSTIESLACWVWEKRFLKTEYSINLGGKLAIDIFQRIVDSNYYRVAVYSGHDYTLLSLLAAMGITDTLEEHFGFGCFLLFEVWQGVPPPLGSQSQSESASVSESVNHGSSDTYVRIILNANPFHLPRKHDLSVHNGTVSSDDLSFANVLETHFLDPSAAHTGTGISSSGHASAGAGARVLAILSIDDIKQRLDIIRSYLELLPAPGGFGPRDLEKESLKAREKDDKDKAKKLKRAKSGAGLGVGLEGSNSPSRQTQRNSDIDSVLGFAPLTCHSSDLMDL